MLKIHIESYIICAKFWVKRVCNALKCCWHMWGSFTSYRESSDVQPFLWEQNGREFMWWQKRWSFVDLAICFRLFY